MRYIGNKTKLLPFIESVINDLNLEKENLIFCDLFAGSGVVGKHFKDKGFDVISNDLQYYSFVLNNGLLNSFNIDEIKINKIIEELNKLELIDSGFIFNNYIIEGCIKNNNKYLRNYFSSYNAKKCDSIRLHIEFLFKESKIDIYEYYYLLASLLNSIDKVSNTSGVYSAFLKHSEKSSLKCFELEPLEKSKNKKISEVYNENSNDLIKNIKGDILYLDPPYNHRQYCDNYHILETIVKYDNPEIKGKTGLRVDNKNIKSNFSYKRNAYEELEDLIKNSNFKYILMSYNNEGILSEEQVKEIFEKYGNYSCVYQTHKRYKSNNNNEQVKNVKEIIHILERI